MLLVRLRGTQLDLMEKKLATHGNLLLFSNFCNSRKMIISLQSMNISTKKLVKRLFVNIGNFENSKTKIPDLYQFLLN